MSLCYNDAFTYFNFQSVQGGARVKQQVAKWLVATIVLTTTVSPSAAMAATNKSEAKTGTIMPSGQLSDLDQIDPARQDAIRKAVELGLISGDPNGRFRPTDTLTRQELAVLLTKALRLQPENVTISSFADVTQGTWGIPYIEAVKQAGLMLGDEGKTFRPNARVTREELAVILVRAMQGAPATNTDFLAVTDRNQISAWAQGAVHTALERNMMQVEGEFHPKLAVERQEIAEIFLQTFYAAPDRVAILQQVTDDHVTVNGITYLISKRLQGILNEQNKTILKGANIRFDLVDRTINKITYLELTHGGEQAAVDHPEFSSNLLLSGNGATIDGTLKVAADFISVQDLTINGDLEIARELQHDFYSKGLSVQGHTLINGGDSNTVVFENATLNQVSVNKPEVRLEYVGDTTVPEMNVTANATIVGDSTAEINQVTVLDGASQVDLQASVDSLIVSSEQNVELLGTGDIKELIIDTTAPVSLNRQGSVQELAVSNPEASVTIGENLSIDNMTLPKSVSPSRVVQNFAQTQTQILSINGAPNAIAPTNLAPVVKNPIPSQIINKGSDPILIDISNVFEDPEGTTLKFGAISGKPAVATVSIVSGTTMMKITPVSAGTATITVTATDTSGKVAFSTITVIVNTVPQAVDIAEQMLTPGAGDRTLDLLNYFSDADATNILTFTAVSADSAIATATVTGNQVVISPVAAGVTDVTITANDGKTGIVSKTFRVVVNNGPEVVNPISDQSATVGADVTVDVTNVFRDLDGDTLIYEATSVDSSVATVSVNGAQVTVTPVGGGSAEIRVTAKDGKGGTVTSTFTIRVNQPPQAGTLADQIVMLGEGDKTIDLSQVFSDVDGDTLTFTAVSLQPNVANANVAGNQLTIHPLAGGTATIQVTANDGKGGTVSDTFNVRINQVPQASDIADLVVTLEAGAKQIDMSSVFTDGDGDTLTLSAVSADTGVATAVVNGAELTVTPVATGTVLITVTANDGLGGIITEMFNLTVKLNEPPQVTASIPDKTLTISSGAVPVDLTNVFTDADGDALTYSADSSDQAVATVVVTGNQLSVTPVADGTATVTVTAQDPAGRTVSTTFTVTVASNQSPAVVGSVPNQVIGVGVPSNQFSIQSLFSDADGDTLTYIVTAADASLVNASISGNTLTLAPGAGRGNTTVTVTADDGKGGTISATIQVQVVQVVHQEQVKTKTGVADVSYDLAARFPGKNAFTVYSQTTGVMTNSGSSALSGTVFRTQPVNGAYWVIADDGTAAFFDVTVQPQSGPQVFFSEYLDAGDGRAALEILGLDDGTGAMITGYSLEIHQYRTDINQVYVHTLPMLPFYPNMTYHIIDRIFYDLFDITNIWYYNDETILSEQNYVPYAFVLKKDGQVVDIIGNTDPIAHTPIFTNGGTIVRKQGIVTGSTQYSQAGEWDLYPKGTLQFYGRHTP